MSAALTDKQAALLEFLRAFEAENDNMPTLQTTAKHFGWSSTNGVLEQLRALERKGCIERNVQGGWRFTRAAADAIEP